LIGASLLSSTLVILGVGLVVLSPNLAPANPLPVVVSLGGFAYMAAALAYVGTIMLLLARPIVQYVFWKLFALDYQSALLFVVPIGAAVILSVSLIVLPLIAAEKRLESATR